MERSAVRAVLREAGATLTAGNLTGALELTAAVLESQEHADPVTADAVVRLRQLVDELAADRWQ